MSSTDNEKVSSNSDYRVGSYRPETVNSAVFNRIDRKRLDELSRVPGLSAEAADFLENLGYRLAIPGSVMPQVCSDRPAVGHAVTLRYLPRRREAHAYRSEHSPSRLAFRTAFETAEPGDVVVMDAAGLMNRSVLGGKAVKAAVDLGISGCVVDGAVRDLDEMEELSFPLWSRARTPLRGSFHVEAVEINTPIACAGIQVLPGDLVLADVSGVAFIPIEHVERFLDGVLG